MRYTNCKHFCSFSSSASPTRHESRPGLEGERLPGLRPALRRQPQQQLLRRLWSPSPELLFAACSEPGPFSGPIPRPPVWLEDAPSQRSIFPYEKDISGRILPDEIHGCIFQAAYEMVHFVTFRHFGAGRRALVSASQRPPAGRVSIRPGLSESPRTRIESLL